MCMVCLYDGETFCTKISTAFGRFWCSIVLRWPCKTCYVALQQACFLIFSRLWNLSFLFFARGTGVPRIWQLQEQVFSFLATVGAAYRLLVGELEIVLSDGATER